MIAILGILKCEDDMATLRIHNVPDDLYERFERFAESQNCSVSALIIYLIEQAVCDFDVLEQRRQALDRIAKRRENLPPTPKDEPDSLTLLREDRTR